MGLRLYNPQSRRWRLNWASSNEGALNQPMIGAYSFASRFEDGTGTNPEELIAAAHAGCVSMALCHVRSGHGHAPRSIKTVARVHVRNVDGMPTIQQIALETMGVVQGLDADHLLQHAQEAKAGCAVSRALRGVEQITVSAKLVS